MAVSVGDLATYLGLGDLDEINDPTEWGQLSRALSMATALVDDALTNAFREVPEIMRDQMILEVGHAYFKRSDSISGTSQFAFEGGTTVFEPKEALSKIMPLLRRYVSPF